MNDVLIYVKRKGRVLEVGADKEMKLVCRNLRRK
jgi:hypothetical protein